MKARIQTNVARSILLLFGICVYIIGGVLIDENDVLRRTELVVEGFVVTEACYSAMEESVANNEGDRRMDAESYVDFVKLYGPNGFLEDVEEFADLPLILQSNFNILACLCQKNSEDTCCVGSRAAIETDGSFADETPTQAEQSYLFLVCSLTSVTIDRVLQSSAPSASPTITPEPTTGPTVTPFPTFLSSETTSAPVAGAEIEVSVTYNIGVPEGSLSADCEDGLIGAMNSLAPQVLAEVELRKLRATNRRLRSVLLDTSISSFVEVECPDGVADSDTCEAVTASMTLLFQPTESDPEGVAATFQENLESAIFAGDLQELLNCTEVYILDQSIVDTPPPTSTSRSVSGGGIAAAVIGSLALVGVIAFLINRTQERKEGLEELATAPKEDPFEEGEDDQGSPDTKATASVVNAAGTSDAVQIQKPKKVFDDDKDANVVDTMSNPDDASSSNAGSSGWSSSAGISSMNTGSAEGIDLDKPGAVAGIGSALAALNERVVPGEAPSPEEEMPSIPTVTRADLDAAIEQGDWAAVGATAALLAAASDSQSYSSKSEQYTGTRSQSGSSVSSIDAARAAELDHLVDAGDWEGVVLAAAKYEADEGKDSTPSESVSADSESRSNTDTAGQTADSSIGSSKALKRQEYRAIVEDLVQRVVPEEIQNVDEMMTQFRGREDELVETLRTMQERAVAQKARQSSQRAAKQQAKMESAAAKAEGKSNIAKSRSIGTGQVSAQATAKSLGTGKIDGATKSKSLGTGVIEKKAAKHETKQSALEDAIERGDWDAVEDAAAILTDNSLASSADTDEINRLADGVSTDGSSAVGSTGQSDAADELEELIEAGDWTGVVQAASKSSTSKDSKKAEEDARRQRRLKHLQEEQEALAQAEIWTKIAEQSKDDSESVADRAAADAADWAISRSLNALVEAEQSGLNDASTDAGSVPRGKTNDDDDSDMEV
ncbi:hypothetical protein IV203_023468 [Nitzschia inconspicua]|uniref:Uncharacterized protein n=1 Tax=Nitzschia inconspicua TaxID=303405 RepID=A0A9K3PCC3_9STRA|nr:hypothetical protein IV203_023468 [Nitzschia inconspicua]